ncbi:MAG: trigger factor [Clostridia bacterium]|nr:trigger factor [Clostridia bacterium]
MSNQNILKVSVKCGKDTKEFDLPYELKKSPLTEVYSFVVDGDLWNVCSDCAFIANKGKFNVLGFRKGHAPRSVIENNYGKDVFVADTEEVVVNEIYNALMETKTINAERLAMRPALDVSKLENGKVEFSLTVAYLPEVTDLKYTGLDIEKVIPDVDGAVEREIAAARDRAGYWNAVERVAKNGDQLNLDYSGSIDGVKFDGGTAEKQNLVLGSGSFIPGFEDQLVGTKAGDSKDVVVKFPEDYHAENLAGKEAVFACKVNSISEKVLPELDDDFAKDVSEFDTFDAYKEDVRKKAEEREVKNAEIATSNRIIETIVKANPIEMSEALIENRAYRMLQDMKTRMESQGIPFATYMQYIGKTEADMIEGYKAEAKEREITRFIMNYVVEKENIQVTQADFDAAIEVRAASAGKKAGDYRRNMSQDEADYILNTLMTDKLIKFLSDNNNIK